ncbi:hypothetical protein KZ483_24050 [Paenibacillus sp. sptzw28]|uniref:hypothetical protein n=1 Tax=Paenibacillus sp. sptzw28 TaxID=715179 RepID=UPI001C6ECB3D|nr:hypothetical protein [Paenibacillus sp. sptzw28]QYR20796.1 hypothetical protein KZ483_24050 [Paenibacillus sp. sptzw28]
MDVYSKTIGGTTYQITVKEDWTWVAGIQEDALAFSDFNRIETNSQTLRNMLTAIQYAIPSLTFVTNRDQTYIELLSGINRVETNLESIRTNFVTPPGYPGTESWTVGKGFDFTDANRLEQDIRLLFQYAGFVYDGFIYCGTVNCGYQRGALPLV